MLSQLAGDLRGVLRCILASFDCDYFRAIDFRVQLMTVPKETMNIHLPRGSIS